MAITLQTASVNFNDGVAYFLQGFDPGPATRDEVWIEPMNSTADPVLAARIDRKTQMTFRLAVKGTSYNNLAVNVKAVRDEFWNVSNTITWVPGGSVTAVQLVTYPSPIVSPLGQGNNILTLSTGQLLLPDWTFQVWRHPYVASAPFVI